MLLLFFCTGNPTRAPRDEDSHSSTQLPGHWLYDYIGRPTTYDSSATQFQPGSSQWNRFPPEKDAFSRRLRVYSQTKCAILQSDRSLPFKRSRQTVCWRDLTDTRRRNKSTCPHSCIEPGARPGFRIPFPLIRQIP